MQDGKTPARNETARAAGGTTALWRRSANWFRALANPHPPMAGEPDYSLLPRDDRQQSGGKKSAWWRPRRIVRFAFLSTAMGALHLLAMTGVVLYAQLGYHAERLPDLRTVLAYTPPLNNVTVDAARQRIDTQGRENREFVAIGNVPMHVRYAFIAAEDQRFYRHGGVDFMATIRAGLTNVDYYGPASSLVGGSTITQQVVKNLLLTPDRTLTRKIREALLSWQLEQRLSKDAILEIYLNHIFLGRNSYGLLAAARAYFRKRVQHLTVAEAALLASLPKAPGRYDPEDTPKLLAGRRNMIIRRMRDLGMITARRARLAIATPIRVVDPKPALTPGFEYPSTEIRRRLPDRVGHKLLSQGGLRIRSTIHPHIQRVAERALRHGLVAYDQRHGWRGPVTRLTHYRGWKRNWRSHLRRQDRPRGAGDWSLAVVLTVKARTVEIGLKDGSRGLISWRDLQWARKARDVRYGHRPVYRTPIGHVRHAGDVLSPGDVILVDRVTNRDQRRPTKGKQRSRMAFYRLRQVPDVGGAVVVMDPASGRVLALLGGLDYWGRQFNAATQAERQPGSAFKPFVYLAAMESGLTPASVVDDLPLTLRLPGHKPYTPRNYSGKFVGQVTYRQALVSSRNIPTIRIGMIVGLSRIARLAERFGVAPKILTVPSMVLGTIETTPLRLAGAYASLVAGGRVVTPVLIESIRDRKGRIVYQHAIPRCPACGRFAAAGPWTRPVTHKGATHPIVDPRSVFQVISMLRDVVDTGTGATVGVLRLPIAGKTGTTNDSMDAWFVGFSRNLLVAVWVGYPNGRSLGPKEQGGHTAAPIARDIFAALLTGTHVAEFSAPSGLARRKVEIPAPIMELGPGGEVTEAPPSDEDRVIIIRPGYSPDPQEPRYVTEWVKTN